MSANADNLGAGQALAQTTAGNVNWREQDYAWTHGAPEEGFFVVLTIAIVPVAILRWRRRLRAPSFRARGRHPRHARS